MILISAKADIDKVKAIFAPFTRDVQTTVVYGAYGQRTPAIVVQFATRAEEERARALVAGKGAGDGKQYA